MSAARLLIFRTYCFAASIVLLSGQQSAASHAGEGVVSIVVPSGDQGVVTELEHYRSSVEAVGFKLQVRTGKHSLATIVSAQGVVKATYTGDSVAAFLVQRLDLATAMARTEIHGKRLDLTLSAAHELTRGRIVLAADLQLKPGIHVYAPGVEGYIPIAWALQQSPDWTARDVVYPEPEILHLAAIDETVPAYQGRFRLTREILISRDLARPILITGTLRYQACDDTMCYIPETLPLRWELGSR